MKIVGLSPAERRMWKAFSRGEEVVFRQADDEPPQLGASWGPKRTIRAEVIRKLLLIGNSDEGAIAALRLTGARISGSLDLQYGTVGHAVRLLACHFERPLILSSAKIGQFDLSQSYLPAIDATTTRIRGVLRITGCRIPGQVKLGGAKISGGFFLDHAHIGDEDGVYKHRDPVLELNHTKIKDDLWGPGLIVHGSLSLPGAVIAGAVNFDDTTVHSPVGVALDAATFAVGTDLSARRIRVNGAVDLRGAKIPGQLDLSGSQLFNPNGIALRADSCTIGELQLRGAAPIQGCVSLRSAKFDLIHVEPNVWPGRVWLEGLTYDSLAPSLPARDRLNLLERDDDGYVPHAYEQLAAAYRRIGDELAVRTVQLAKQRHHRRTLPWYAKIWGYLQDVTVGYGFRPGRAMAWLMALLFTGSIAFGFYRPVITEPGHTTQFNAVIYTLDLLLPIVDLGQENEFSPSGSYEWLSDLLIASGWVLTTTVVAGVTRTINRQ